jgi:hypothetical protein
MHRVSNHESYAHIICITRYIISAPVRNNIGKHRMNSGAIKIIAMLTL